MEHDKIYYALVILISAVSILLSPFAYARIGKRSTAGKPLATHWKTIFLANLAAALILLSAWWLWWR